MKEEKFLGTPTRHLTPKAANIVMNESKKFDIVKLLILNRRPFYT